jgi:hypothetical protein
MEDMAAKNRCAFVVPGMLALLCAVQLYAQQAQKPLTNDDVITMVGKKLPESVIVAAIQAGPANFDTSTNELIRLNTAGVTEKELNAILAASSKGAAAPAGSGSNETAGILASSASRKPRVAVIQGSTTQELPLEKAQLAQTKTKPSSMKALAADSAVTQSMLAGVNTAVYGATTHMTSPVGGFAAQQAGSVFAGAMTHHTATVTYVWGVPGPASVNVLQTTKPTFVVDFSRAIAVNPDEYQPAIVKLTPAQNTCRVAGATEGKEDARSSPAVDWQVYSHFLEERVAATPQKLGSGKYKVAANAELAPGEYAVVLRPLSTDKKFSGGDVSRAQGDGLMFDAIWTFQISEDAQ